MKWEVESWRKLYLKRDAEWIRLPQSARGLAVELLVLCDDEGFIGLNDVSTPSAVADGIGILCSAHRTEYKRIEKDVQLLLGGKKPFLVAAENGLQIRNFKAAQSRSTSADRMARKRAKDRAGASQEGVTVREQFANGDGGSDGDVRERGGRTVHEQSDGSETRRDETIFTHTQNAHARDPDSGAAGASPAAASIRAALDAAGCFEQLDTPTLAATLDGRYVLTGAVPLGLVLDAIREAADVTGATPGEPAAKVASRILAFVRNAGKRAREDAPNGHQRHAGASAPSAGRAHKPPPQKPADEAPAPEPASHELVDHLAADLVAKLRGVRPAPAEPPPVAPAEAS